MAMVNWRIRDPFEGRGGSSSSSLLSQGNKGLQWPDPDFSQAKNMDFKCWQLIQRLIKKEKRKLYRANKTFAWRFHLRAYQFANLADDEVDKL